MRVISAALVSGALLVAVGTARAQSAPGPGVSTAASPKNAGPGETWNAKPVGKYDLFINIPEGAMPVEVTVKESAGILTALFWKVGDNDAHFMNVSVKDSDLILTGQTEHGALTMTIQHHGTALTGTWQLGEGHGTLEGTTKS